MTNAPKSSTHPMILAAAAAVLLACGVGVAAMLGWLPSSTGQNQAAGLDANGQPLVQQSTPGKDNTPVNGQPKAPVREAYREPAREPARESAREPVRQAAQERAPVKHTPVRSAAAVCDNCGVVEAVNPIDTRAEGSGVGAVGGALVGGLLGNQVGDGNGRKLATVAGAIGGAVAGNQIEGRVKANRSYDIVVRLNDGSTRTFHQTEQPAWQAGDQVRVVNGGLRAYN